MRRHIYSTAEVVLMAEEMKMIAAELAKKKEKKEDLAKLLPTRVTVSPLVREMFLPLKNNYGEDVILTAYGPIAVKNPPRYGPRYDYPKLAKNFSSALEGVIRYNIK